MFRTCIDSTLDELARLETDSRIFSPPMKIQIRTLQLGLKFLKLFIWCLGKWNSANKNLRSRSILEIEIGAAIRMAGRGLFTAAHELLPKGISYIRYKKNRKMLDLMASSLLEKLEQFKPKIKATCLDHLDCSLPCKSPTSYEFVESILQNLDDLVSLKVDMIFSMKQQIEMLQEKLKLYCNFNGFAGKLCINHEEFKEPKIHSQSWAYDAACLSLLYWVDNLEEVVPRMNFLFSEMIQKTMPVVLEVGMYFGVSSKSLRHESLPVAEVVHDHFEILHEGLLGFF